MGVDVLFRMPFRPFFPAAAAFAAVAVPLWLLNYVNGLPLRTIGLQWHIHEMLTGFAATVVLGFVLTAVQTWTGLRTVHGPLLSFLLALWCIARIGWLLPPPGFWLAVSADALLFSAAAVLVGRLVYRSANWRNAFFVPVFLLFAGFSAVYGYALWRDDPSLATRLQYLMFFLIAHIVLVVGGRVIPFFTDRRLRRRETRRYRWLETGSLASSLAFLPAVALGLDGDIVRSLAALVAAFHLMRWLSWKPWESRAIALLWSLHLAYAFVLLGFCHIAASGPGSVAAHLIGVGGIGFMILAMMSRVALGHTGRPLELPGRFALAYYATVLGTLVRVSANLIPELHTPLLWLAAACWVAAFGLFLYYYLPLLSSPRPDGRPG